MSNKGFSLLEVLVATVVITAIMGIVVTKFQSNVSDAKTSQYMQELKTVKNAAAQYYNVNHTWNKNAWSSMSSNVDTKLGRWMDGNLSSRWFADCDNINGVTVGLHHLQPDTYYRLLPEFQKVCPLGVVNGLGDANAGNYINCVIKPAASITGAATQCI